MTQVDLAIAFGSALAVTEASAPRLHAEGETARYRTYFAALLYTALALEPINVFFLTRWFDWNTTYMIDPARVNELVFTVAVLVGLVLMTLLGARLGIGWIYRRKRSWARAGWIIMAGWTVLWNVLYAERAARVGTYEDWIRERGGGRPMPKIWETGETPFLIHFVIIGLLFALALVGVLFYARRGGRSARAAAQRET
jgi:hypothetical protein